MANKDEVTALYVAHPDWPASRIAKELGCTSAYVRSTLRRNHLAPRTEKESVIRRHGVVSVFEHAVALVRRAQITGESDEQIARRLPEGWNAHGVATARRVAIDLGFIAQQED